MQALTSDMPPEDERLGWQPAPESVASASVPPTAAARRGAEVQVLSHAVSDALSAADVPAVLTRVIADYVVPPVFEWRRPFDAKSDAERDPSVLHVTPPVDGVAAAEQQWTPAVATRSFRDTGLREFSVRIAKGTCGVSLGPGPEVDVGVTADPARAVQLVGADRRAAPLCRPPPNTYTRSRRTRENAPFQPQSASWHGVTSYVPSASGNGGAFRDAHEELHAHVWENGVGRPGVPSFPDHWRAGAVITVRCDDVDDSTGDGWLSMACNGQWFERGLRVSGLLDCYPYVAAGVWPNAVGAVTDPSVNANTIALV